MIEEHIENLRGICQSASEMTFQKGNYVWYEYFERNNLFFSTMLASKGAPDFYSCFLDLVIEEFKIEVEISV